MNCELNSEPVFASLSIKKLSKTQRNRVSLQFTDRVFGIVLRPHFGEFRVGWPLIICEIHHMGSNMSEIRLSFVIIGITAKSFPYEYVNFPTPRGIANNLF